MLWPIFWHPYFLYHNSHLSSKPTWADYKHSSFFSLLFTILLISSTLYLLVLISLGYSVNERHAWPTYLLWCKRRPVVHTTPTRVIPLLPFPVVLQPMQMNIGLKNRIFSFLSELDSDAWYQSETLSHSDNYWHVHCFC